MNYEICFVKAGNYSSQFSDLKEKLQKLVYLQRTLMQKNQKLETENLKLKSGMNEKEESLNEMKERMKVLMLTSTASGNDLERQELRNKVNGLIREVDKCISLLNA